MVRDLMRGHRGQVFRDILIIEPRLVRPATVFVNFAGKCAPAASLFEPETHAADASEQINKTKRDPVR